MTVRPCRHTSPMIMTHAPHALVVLGCLVCPWAPVQVHDELLFEVSVDLLAEGARLIRGVMEAASQVWGLRVLLPVKLSVGPSWGQLQELPGAKLACRCKSFNMLFC